MGKILCLLGLLFLWLQVGLSQGTPDPAPNATSSNCSSTVVVEVTIPSEDSKRQLTRFLTQDSPNVRLIFLYFDLNVSSQERIYHPGSCPNDGFSPIDAQTPLAWVLTFLPNGDNIFDHFNFPRAYLTLPVAHPRLYSAGYLDDKYVRYMNYARSKLEVRVTDSLTQSNDSCWLSQSELSLSLQEKASLVNEQINRRVAELLQTNMTVSNWKTCYSKPISNADELPISVSDFLPNIPVYVCSDSNGDLADGKLETDDYLGWFKALTLVLGYGSVVLQVYVLFKLLFVIRSWGVEKANTSKSAKAKDYIGLEPKYVCSDHLPTRFTIAGLLQSDNMLGQVPFKRAKSIFAAVVLLGLVVVFPFVLLFKIFQGYSGSEKNTGHQLLEEDTFGPCDTYTDSIVAKNSLFVIVISITATAILIITMIGLHFRDWFDTTMLHILQESTRVPARWGYIISNVPVIWVRHLLSGPGATVDKSDTVSQRDYNVRLISKWVLWVVLILPLYPIVYIFLEVIEAVGTVMLPAVFIFSYDVVRKAHQRSGLLKAATRLFALAIFSFLPFPLIFLSIFSREVFCFISMTFIGFFLRNPVQTSMITTWVITLLAQAKKIFRSYEAPVKAINKLHTKKVRKIINKSQFLTDVTDDDRDDDLIQTLPGKRLCLRKSSRLRPYGNIDWETFLSESECVFDSACYQHLLNKCPYSYLGIMAIAHRKLSIGPIEILCPDWPIDPKRYGDVNHEMPKFESRLWLLQQPCSRPGAVSEQEQRRAKVRNDVKYFLQVRLFNHIIVGVVGACVLLLFLFLLLSFDELWHTAKSQLNAVLLNALFIPIFIYISGGGNTSPLGGDKERLKKIIDHGLKKALQKAKEKFDEGNAGSGEAPTLFLTSENFDEISADSGEDPASSLTSENAMPENPTNQSRSPRSSEISSQSDRRPLLAAKRLPQTGGHSAGPPAPHCAAPTPPGRRGAPPAPGKPGPPPPPHKGGTPPPPGPPSRNAGAPPPPGPPGRSAAQPAPSRRRPPPPPAHGGGGGNQLSESVYESYELPQPGFKMQQRATSNA